ncbi:MAG: 2-oxoacid:acceptor oxidoreductase family protein [Anaerotardibacter sp.]
MINVSIAGVGGQGNVLAARILAQAAMEKGWQVRGTETIGMAQRGGNVVSHVRMGNKNEEVFSPLPAKGSVDVLIALEPGEGARCLDLLKKDGVLVICKTGIPAVTAAWSKEIYQPMAVVEELESKGINVVVVDDQRLCNRLASRKCLNVIVLAYALHAVNSLEHLQTNALSGQITLDDMKAAIPLCVKTKLVDINQRAIRIVKEMADF